MQPSDVDATVCLPCIHWLNWWTTHVSESDKTQDETLTLSHHVLGLSLTGLGDMHTIHTSSPLNEFSITSQPSHDLTRRMVAWPQCPPLLGLYYLPFNMCQPSDTVHTPGIHYHNLSTPLFGSPRFMTETFDFSWSSRSLAGSTVLEMYHSSHIHSSLWYDLDWDFWMFSLIFQEKVSPLGTP